MTELSNNKEIFMDTDCTAAFHNAQAKFATYVQELATAKLKQMQK